MEEKRYRRRSLSNKKDKKGESDGMVNTADPRLKHHTPSGTCVQTKQLSKLKSREGWNSKNKEHKKSQGIMKKLFGKLTKNKGKSKEGKDNKTEEKENAADQVISQERRHSAHQKQESWPHSKRKKKIPCEPDHVVHSYPSFTPGSRPHQPAHTGNNTSARRRRDRTSPKDSHTPGVLPQTVQYVDKKASERKGSPKLDVGQPRIASTEVLATDCNHQPASSRGQAIPGQNTSQSQGRKPCSTTRAQDVLPCHKCPSLSELTPASLYPNNRVAIGQGAQVFHSEPKLTKKASSSNENNTDSITQHNHDEPRPGQSICSSTPSAQTHSISQTELKFNGDHQQHLNTVKDLTDNMLLPSSSQSHRLSNIHSTAELPSTPAPRLSPAKCGARPRPLDSHVPSGTDSDKETYQPPPDEPRKTHDDWHQAKEVRCEPVPFLNNHMTSGDSHTAENGKTVECENEQSSLSPESSRVPTIVHYHLTIQNCDGLEIYVDRANSNQTNPPQIRPKTVYTADGKKHKRLSWIELPTRPIDIENVDVPKVASVPPNVRSPPLPPSPAPDESEIFISEEAERLFEGQEQLILETNGSNVGEPGDVLFEEETIALLNTSPYGMTEYDTGSISSHIPDELSDMYNNRAFDDLHDNNQLQTDIQDSYLEGAFNPYDYDFMYEHLGDRGHPITDREPPYHQQPTESHIRHIETSGNRYQRHQYPPSCDPPESQPPRRPHRLFPFRRRRFLPNNEVVRDCEDEAVQTDLVITEDVSTSPPIRRAHSETRNAECQTQAGYQQQQSPTMACQGHNDSLKEKPVGRITPRVLQRSASWHIQERDRTTQIREHSQAQRRAHRNRSFSQRERSERHNRNRIGRPDEPSRGGIPEDTNQSERLLHPGRSPERIRNQYREALRSRVVGTNGMQVMQEERSPVGGAAAARPPATNTNSPSIPLVPEEHSDHNRSVSDINRQLSYINREQSYNRQSPGSNPSLNIPYVTPFGDLTARPPHYRFNRTHDLLQTSSRYPWSSTRASRVVSGMRAPSRSRRNAETIHQKLTRVREQLIRIPGVLILGVRRGKIMITLSPDRRTTRDIVSFMMDNDIFYTEYECGVLSRQFYENRLWTAGPRQIPSH